jgi:XTP/dITP diphosphohydrolase
MIDHILIATSNEGKLAEFSSQFKDLNFKFLSLKEVGLDTVILEEPYETTWENALHKAQYYSKKTNLIAIAEDSGFFVDYLNGAPGIKSRRFAPTDEKRCLKVLQALKGVPVELRAAHFQASGCLYNPFNNSFNMFEGRVDGLVTELMSNESRPGMGFDTIFYYPTLQKTFAELSIAEKNTVSHRGQIIKQLKVYLARQFGFIQFICPVALLIHNKRIFLNKRRDSVQELNDKWEFPGGGVENGEGVEECLKREVQEETGFTVKIEEILPKVYSTTNEAVLDPYQVFLIPYVCSIEKGEVAVADEESSGHGWFTLNEALNLDLLPLNKKCIQDNIELIKKYID